ncbi:MAG: alpha/beta hydrolase, partial [Bacilli bacterium]
IEIVRYNPLSKKNDDIIITDSYMIPIRIFMPDGNEPSKIIIFYHGGGFVTGSVNAYNKICQKITNKTNALVIAIDYRLAPEYPFPIGLNDCYEATKELYKLLKKAGVRSKDIILMGDSAGGNMAAVISIMARDKKDFKVHKQILLYPLVDTNHSENSPYPSVYINGKDFILTRKRIQQYLKLYLPNEKDWTNPLAAPILAKLDHQPKSLIITAEFDPLRDEGYAYSEKLKFFRNNVVYYEMKDSIHGFISLNVNSKISKKTFSLINEFIGKK